MMRLQFKLQIPVQYVGTLVLMGENFDGVNTTAYFVCYGSRDEALVSYLNHWSFPHDHEFITGNIHTIAALEDNHELNFFTRIVEGELRDPHQFLCKTAGKLLRELQQAEDVELSMVECEAAIKWITENANCHGDVPDFTRPRHR